VEGLRGKASGVAIFVRLKLRGVSEGAPYGGGLGGSPQGKNRGCLSP
jgi:hypothetical protein